MGLLLKVSYYTVDVLMCHWRRLKVSRELKSTWLIFIIFILSSATQISFTLSSFSVFKALCLPGAVSVGHSHSCESVSLEGVGRLRGARAASESHDS